MLSCWGKIWQTVVSGGIAWCILLGSNLAVAGEGALVSLAFKIDKPSGFGSEVVWPGTECLDFFLLSKYNSAI